MLPICFEGHRQKGRHAHGFPPCLSAVALAKVDSSCPARLQKRGCNMPSSRKAARRATAAGVAQPNGKAVAVRGDGKGKIWSHVRQAMKVWGIKYSGKRRKR